MGAFSSTPVFVNKEKRTVVFGPHHVSFHPKMSGNKVKVVDNQCYIDGFELVNGKWKVTFWSLWHKYVN